MLSDLDLVTQLSYGNLVVEPLDKELIGPASIDLVLGGEFLVPAQGWPHTADPSVDTAGSMWESRSVEALKIRPGQFLLGSTRESVSVGAGLAARLEGKSSLGRLGLLVHATAGFIDPGFSGQITLELSNVAPWPIMLYAGMRVAQLSVFALSSPAATPYGLARGSKYQGQHGPQPSKGHQDWQLR